MLGSFLSGVFITAFGYVYPAYECYKTVELNKPEIEQLRFWCQYWILVALLTVFERIGDTFISWLPLYSEAKVAFYIYLWYPRTKGTTYVYENFFRPFIAKHEPEIDRNLLELRTRAGDMILEFWQNAARYGQTRFFEILQYVASQSHALGKETVQQQQQQQLQAHQAHSATPLTTEFSQQASRVSSKPIKTQVQDANPAATPAQPQASGPSEETMEVDIIDYPENDESNPPTAGGEAMQLARARLKKRAVIGRSSN